MVYYGGKKGGDKLKELKDIEGLENIESWEWKDCPGGKVTRISEEMRDKMETIKNTEIWKDVPSYEGHYQVSSLGKTRTVAMTDEGCVYHPSLACTTNISSDGYEAVWLDKEGTSYSYPIHKLVATLFLENRENKVEVKHKNGIKTDNRAENLEWIG